MEVKDLEAEMDKALHEIIDVPKIMNFQMDLIEDAFKKGLNLGIKVGKAIDKWHNLEENPKDFPENMKQVIVELSDGSFSMGWYSFANERWWANDCPDWDDELAYHDYVNDIHVVPIKWKEIIS